MVAFIGSGIDDKPTPLSEVRAGQFDRQRKLRIHTG